jgi:hypothetical protein
VQDKHGNAGNPYEHEPWPLHPTEFLECDDQLPAAASLPAVERPPSSVAPHAQRKRPSHRQSVAEHCESKLGPDRARNGLRTGYRAFLESPALAQRASQLSSVLHPRAALPTTRLTNKRRTLEQKMVTITNNHGAAKAAAKRSLPHFALPLSNRLVRGSALAGVLMALWVTIGPRLSESGLWHSFTAIADTLWTVVMGAAALLILWFVYLVSIFVH